MSFQLHPRLAADAFNVASLPICELLLMNDARFPWCILVPRIHDLRELHEVPRDQREALMDEVDAVSRVLSELADAAKMNVAALGNQVPQLHIHVIARQTEDAAWPGPVWGVGSAEPYADAKPLIQALSRRLTP